MIERSTLLLAFGTTLLVAVLSTGWAYWNQRDLVDERERRFEHARENERLQTELQRAVQKNLDLDLDLARRQTQLAHELAEKKTALRDAFSPTRFELTCRFVTSLAKTMRHQNTFFTHDLCVSLLPLLKPPFVATTNRKTASKKLNETTKKQRSTTSLR